MAESCSLLFFAKWFCCEKRFWRCWVINAEMTDSWGAACERRVSDYWFVFSQENRTVCYCQNRPTGHMAKTVHRQSRQTGLKPSSLQLLLNRSELRHDGASLDHRLSFPLKMTRRQNTPLLCSWLDERSAEVQLNMRLHSSNRQTDTSEGQT